MPNKMTRLRINGGKNCRHGDASWSREQLTHIWCSNHHVGQTSNDIYGMEVILEKTLYGEIWLQVFDITYYAPIADADDVPFKRYHCIISCVWSKILTRALVTTTKAIEKNRCGNINDNGRKLCDPCVKNYLAIVGTLFLHRKSHKLTSLHHGKTHMHSLIKSSAASEAVEELTLRPKIRQLLIPTLPINMRTTMRAEDKVNRIDATELELPKRKTAFQWNSDPALHPIDVRREKYKLRVSVGQREKQEQRSRDSEEGKKRVDTTRNTRQNHRLKADEGEDQSVQDPRGWQTATERNIKTWIKRWKRWPRRAKITTSRISPRKQKRLCKTWRWRRTISTMLWGGYSSGNRSVKDGNGRILSRL